jgi:DNA-binding IclR family transcriptional regulator
MEKKSKAQSKESERHVESVIKAIEILGCFTVDEPQLSLMQLSEKTGLYKSGITRICGTLTAYGFLVREPGPIYKLGPRLMTLGKIYEQSNTLLSLAQPIMRELVSLTSETAELYVLDGKKRICIAVEEAPSSIRYVMKEGESLELHAGASGKLFLAYSSEAFRTEILNEKVLEKFTDKTIVARDQLAREFETIRQKGYATSMSERYPEVAAIAAPIYDHDESVVAALSISGPEYRFTKKHRNLMLESLLSSARKLSYLLGRVDDKE